MLAVSFKISSIDYENTAKNIFPFVSEKISSTNSRSMVVRLFQELGDAALPIMLDLMSRLPEDTKDELLMRGLNAYSTALTEKINEELQSDKWGLSIGTLSITRNDGIFLNIGQVDVDYRVLIDSERVGGAIDRHLGMFSGLAKKVARTAISFASDKAERKVVEFLGGNDNKERLTELLRDALFRHGIKIGLEDIRIIYAEPIAEDSQETNQTLVLTEKIEDDIISALAGYLRDNRETGTSHA